MGCFCIPWEWPSWHHFVLWMLTWNIINSKRKWIVCVCTELFWSGKLIEAGLSANRSLFRESVEWQLYILRLPWGHFLNKYSSSSKANGILPAGSLCWCVFFSATDNDVNVEGVVMLAGALCSCHNLTEIHIRYWLFYTVGIKSFCSVSAPVPSSLIIKKYIQRDEFTL